MALGIIYDDVTDSAGNAIANIDVTIYIAGTVTKASLFDASEGGSPISNPVQTNDKGVFSAYVAAGDYDVSVDAPGGTVVRPNFTVADGDDIADLLSVRELGAITSADKVTYDGESATVDVALDARVPTVATLAALQAVSTTDFTGGERRSRSESTSGDGLRAEYIFRSGDQSASVAAKISNEWVVPADRTADGSNGAWEQITDTNKKIYAAEFLQTTSDILNGERISLFRFIDKAKHSGLRARTNTEDLQTVVQDAVDAFAASGVTGGYLAVPPCTIHLGSPVLVPAEVTIDGSGMLVSTFKAAPGATLDYLFANAAQDGTQESFVLKNLALNGNKGSATVNQALAYMKSQFVGSELANILAWNTTSRGIELTNGEVGTAGSGPIYVRNIWTNQTDLDGFVVSDFNAGGVQTGLILLQITTENYGENMAGMLLKGNASASQRTLGIQVYGHHVEVSGNNRTGLKIDGVADVMADNVQIIGSPGTGCIGAHITNDARNERIKIRNLQNINLFTNAIKDDKNSVTYGAVNVGEYKTADNNAETVEQTLTYGPTISTDCTKGLYSIIVVTDANAFTIDTPTNALPRQRLTYEIVNASGGAMGTITWGAGFAYRDASFANPANGKRRLITFVYRGGGIWAQDGAATGDM